MESRSTWLMHTQGSRAVTHLLVCSGALPWEEGAGSRPILTSYICGSVTFPRRALQAFSFPSHAEVADFIRQTKDLR